MPDKASKSERNASPPRGKLLSEIVDLATEMGILYQRSVAYRPGRQVHDRDLLVFPRGASRAAVRPRGATKPLTITSTSLLFIPRGMPYETQSLSAIHDAICLLPSAAYMTQMLHENGLSAADAKALRSAVKLRRSRWLDDLVERYFFERVRNARSPAGCAFFLEKQMVNELARLVFPGKLETHGGDVRELDDGLVEQALRLIESRLFEELPIDAVAEAAKSSPASLLRAFKRELGTTPGRYVKERRLDEAALMLERGGHRVGDVATMVGYQDLSAFTRAFRTRFGVGPAGFRDRGERA